MILGDFLPARMTPPLLPCCFHAIFDPASNKIPLHLRHECEETNKGLPMSLMYPRHSYGSPNLRLFFIKFLYQRNNIAHVPADAVNAVSDEGIYLTPVYHFPSLVSFLPRCRPFLPPDTPISSIVSTSSYPAFSSTSSNRGFSCESVRCFAVDVLVYIAARIRSCPYSVSMVYRIPIFLMPKNKRNPSSFSGTDLSGPLLTE